jgi:hypothetical protein
MSQRTEKTSFKALSPGICREIILIGLLECLISLPGTVA